MFADLSIGEREMDEGTEEVKDNGVVEYTREKLALNNGEWRVDEFLYEI